MKRGLIAAGAVAMLLLTGCTAQEPAISDATGSNDAAAGAAAPLVASTPTPTTDGGEAAFLAEVRANLRPDNVIPDATDEQLVAAGEKACEAIATTANTNTVSVIEGEPTNGLGYYTDSGVIIAAARGALCG
ncbi:DUF732 domain-containing protein [Microbacterium testaceum]|uniref:DUF732 domain-containing protein n=1 Tax=Microbacterium testaceum TaxID=2033 RepID=UPI001D17CFB0|nr:DUF732 domain-containing protein [Microbacterium testaceum]MCC4250726.1 DUF732 domain-containing protein [Microbacterium testaceum]